ncbi:MAG: hypothetical protein K9G30_02550 [Parvibaculum sp.]|nr:hypothetical protein [Parvibaculum sp.]
MTRFRKTLLTGAAAFALLAAPAAMAQQTSTTVITNTSGTADAVVIDTGRTDSVTTVTTTTTSARPVMVDHVAHLEAMGYSNVRQRPGVALESQIAFSAANEWGHPVKLIVDRDTGVVVRETSMRTLDKPSKR